MPLPSQFYRLTLRWDLPGGEKAHTSCFWRPENTSPHTFSADAAILAGKALTFWNAIADNYSTETKYIGSAVDLVGVDGRKVQGLDFSISPAAGGSGAAPLAPRGVRGDLFVDAIHRS